MLEQSAPAPRAGRASRCAARPKCPPTVFVKLAPSDERQRKLVNMTGMGVAEARFYRDLAHEIPVRVPDVWFADTDDDRYVMVLEDLDCERLPRSRHERRGHRQPCARHRRAARRAPRAVLGVRSLPSPTTTSRGSLHAASARAVAAARSSARPSNGSATRWVRASAGSRRSTSRARRTSASSGARERARWCTAIPTSATCSSTLPTAIAPASSTGPSCVGPPASATSPTSCATPSRPTSASRTSAR